MVSGRPLTSRARGWKEGRPEEAGTSCLTGRIPASLSQCVTSQQQSQELLWGSTFTKGNLIQIYTPSASTFIRSGTSPGWGGFQLCVLLHYRGVSGGSWGLMPDWYIGLFSGISFFSINSLSQLITHDIVIWYNDIMLAHIYWSGKHTVLINPLDCMSRSRVKGQFSETRTS